MELGRESFGYDYNQPTSQKLRRTLGFFDGLCIIVCIMIGSGIFASPGTAVDSSGSIGASLICWLLSGVIVFIASLCYIELAVIMPGVGGDFVYLSRAFGPTASFSFAWYYFWIAKPGTQAMVASVFGSYFVTIFTGLDNANESSTASKIAAVLLIVLFTFLNCFGIMEAVVVVRFFTIMKFILVSTVLISTIYFLSSHSVNENLSPSHSFDGTNQFGFGQSLIACLWAFEGWADLNFLSEELLHYEKRVGPICMLAISVVTCCFVLINVCYFAVLDKSQIIHSDAIAIDFGREISSTSSLPTFFAIAVAISAAGAANSLIMTGGRAFYAIAQARQAPMMMARLNYAGVPAMSLTAQAIWSIVLILLPGSSFENLLQYMGPASWLFYALSCCAVIKLRISEPKLQRSFRVPLYPLPPLIIVGVASFILVDTLAREPFFTFLSLGFIALSFPVWWILNKFNVFPVEENHSHLTTSLLMPIPRTLSNGFF